MEKESQKKISEIGDATDLARVKMQADGRLYAAQLEAESNKVRQESIVSTLLHHLT